MRAEIVGATSSEFETVSVIVPSDSELGQELAAIERDYPEGIPCEAPRRGISIVRRVFDAVRLGCDFVGWLVFNKFHW